MQPLLDELASLRSRLPDAGEALAALAKPMARMGVADGPPTDAGASYVGGHPYLPAGAEWPLDAQGRARVFVMQVNFADVPPLPGFPREGLLQWFVTDEDGYGLAPEEGDGEREGFVARWYAAAELGADSPPPTHPRPEHRVDPVTVSQPLALTFTSGVSMPARDEMEVWDGAEEEWVELWDDEEEDETWIGNGSKVGGYPHVVQLSPVDSFSVEEDPSAQLLVQLDSDADRWTEWGDVGTAQLFGDPAALARGELDSLWWTWACS